MKYLLGIDVGTSGTKSVLFDELGNVKASATEEYPLIQPENGWAEQNPTDWWNAVCKTLKVLAEKASDGEIAGVGLTGQMHGLVMLDKSGEVIRNSIIWCDGRTSEECEEIESLVGHEKLIDITANPALPGFTASKIMWVKKHEPENYEKCAHILLPKDYIRYKLTGEFVTDVSDASGMQLLDIKNRCWSDEILKILDIEKEKLAKVCESPEISGYITKEASLVTGLGCGIPVCAGAGDNAAAAVGMGVYKDGKAFTTVGTSGVVFAHTKNPVIDKEGRVHTFCAAVPNEWHVMGVTQAAGLSFNWFKNTLAENLSYKELDEKAEKLPIGSEKLIYLPYLMGERTPILNSDARGVFFGLSAIHKKAHMARAVMEGVGFSLKSCLDVLAEMNILVDDMAICGGGGKSKLWRGMIADIYNTDLKLLENDEGPAFGAALLAGVASGVYKNVGDACENTVKVKEEVKSDEGKFAEYMKFYEIYKALYPGIKNQFSMLKNIK